MKVYISADIEGVAGVVTAAQGQPGNTEYERARELMTGEVNASIEGAFEGGASYVLVNDSHGPMTNLLPDRLDPRADLILGRPKLGNMVSGLTEDFDALFLVGYHAGAGSYGVLSHTVTGAFQAVRLNGLDASEAALYGAYAGHLGVPVALLTGDDQLKKQCNTIFPNSEIVVVKTSFGYRSACSRSPAIAREHIRAAAKRALIGLQTTVPFTIKPPVRLEIAFLNPAMADMCAIIPSSVRVSPREVAFDCSDIIAAAQWVNVAAVLAGSMA